MKSNFKLIIGIIIGFILSSGVVYAVTLYQAKEVAYDNSSSGSTSTDVQSAIDELYQMASNYIDVSGANSPVLLDNMVPIKNNGSYWEVADLKDEWYNYDKKLWANAVVLKEEVGVGEEVTEENIDLWLVWIPRYKYQLFNANNGSVNPLEIQIEFESGTETTGTVRCVDNISGSGSTSETCTNASNGNWYTHPAFTFGDEELTGIWVGKFEVSGTVDKITTIPNVSSLRNQTLSSFFNAILKVKDTYNLNGDSHMIKNTYLSHSKYGTCTNGTCTEVVKNTNSGYYTGGGTNDAYKTNVSQSTTKNIYGIYDMSGGAYEYIMGNMVNSSGSFYSSSSGFVNAPEDKYYDKYAYETSRTTHGRGKLGDATKETLKIFGNALGGWYGDDSAFPEYNNHNSWMPRGGGFSDGSGVGIFGFRMNAGQPYDTCSSRVVIVSFT